MLWSCSAKEIELLTAEKGGPPDAGSLDAETPRPGDTMDDCPDDVQKTMSGVCGCGTPDSDSDADGMADCLDECPNDTAKTERGLCGCGVIDTPACAGSTTPQWTPVSGGAFEMGSTVDPDEQPVHTVTVPSFEMNRTEVKVAEYMQCVIAGACSEPGTWSENCYWNRPGFEDHPINCVDWNSAVAFCQWIGARLPSEAEWEYAARAGGRDITYPWGDQSPSCQYAVMSEGGDGCGEGVPAPVCSKIAGNTAQELCDMAGNVFEWVQDAWHGNYDGAPTDGSAWEGGSLRPVRGGSMVSNAAGLRSAARGTYFGPTYQNIFIGLRCARSVTAQP